GPRLAGLAGLLQLSQGLHLPAVGEPSVHPLGEVQDVPVLDELEERPALGQLGRRDGERVLGRLAEGHVLAVPDEALLDDLAAEDDADPEDLGPRSLGLLRWRHRSLCHAYTPRTGSIPPTSSSW